MDHAQYSAHLNSISGNSNMDFVEWTGSDALYHSTPLQTKSFSEIQECTQQVYLNVFAEQSVINEALALCFTMPFPQVLQALGL